ncbi:MAG TPA: TIGR00730 family Rossman fold protein, partial [Terriglobales bacterium]
MSEFKRVGVFCGSSSGIRPQYSQTADAVGRILAEQRLTLVYGGGKVGLMGTLANAALAAGGEVIGVIPHALMLKEVGHTGLTKLRIANTMHERKALMAELSDAFIALPGGYGTLDEFCEILTWAQLGLHNKPCGILNVNGYYDPLLELFQKSVAEGFLRKEHADMLMVESDPEKLLQQFA